MALRKYLHYTQHLYTMSKFTNINTNFTPDVNFWELNPQLIIMDTFDECYALDAGGIESSKIMWCVFFLSDPDGSVNKFYRQGKIKTKQTLSETYYPDVDWDSELFKRLTQTYESVCLTSPQRALKDIIDLIVRRNDFLVNLEFDLDTMVKLDNALVKGTKIFDDYDKLKQRFLDSKDVARLKGGRKKSKSETGEV